MNAKKWVFVIAVLILALFAKSEVACADGACNPPKSSGLIFWTPEIGNHKELPSQVSGTISGVNPGTATVRIEAHSDEEFGCGGDQPDESARVTVNGITVTVTHNESVESKEVQVQVGKDGKVKIKAEALGHPGSMYVKVQVTKQSQPTPEPSPTPKPTEEPSPTPTDDPEKPPEDSKPPKKVSTPTPVPIIPDGYCVGGDTITAERVYEGTSFSDIIRYDIQPGASVIEYTLTDNLPPAVNSHPSIEPNFGCREVWSRTEKGEENSILWTHGLDGSDPAPIKNLGEPIIGTQPSWGLGGEIVYVSKEGDLRATGRWGSFIRRLGVKGTYPEVAPDGKSVAYTSPSGNLCFVSIHGAKIWNKCSDFGGHTTRWDSNGRGFFYLTDTGLQFFDVTTEETRSIYDNGIDLAPDPQGSMAAVVVELLKDQPEQLWLVNNITAINQQPTLAESSSFSLTADREGESNLNPDWFSPDRVEANMLLFELWTYSL